MYAWWENVVADLVPDERSAHLLIAAVNAGAVDELRRLLGQSLDAGAAVHLTASSLVQRRGLDPGGATWAVTQFHDVMSARVAGTLPAAPGSARPVSTGGSTQPDTTTSPPDATIPEGVSTQPGCPPSNQLDPAPTDRLAPSAFPVAPSAQRQITHVAAPSTWAPWPTGSGMWAPAAPPVPGPGRRSHRRRWAVAALVAAVVVAGGAAFAVSGTGSGRSTPSTWRLPVPVDSGSSPNATAVDCLSPSNCLYADDAGGVRSLDPANGALGPLDDVDANTSLVALSCPTADFCAAVDKAGNALTESNGRWGHPVALTAAAQLNAVSCATATFCVAVDGAGHAYTFRGQSWTSRTIVVNPTDGAGIQLNDVSCPITTFCVAVDDDGDGVTLKGSTWTIAPIDQSGNNLNAVSCPSSSFCAAVDPSGGALIFQHGAWGPVTAIDPGHALVAVNCPRLGFCAAVDDDGQATVYQNSAWGSMQRVDGTTGFAAVSCTSETQCLALDSNGYRLSYGPA